MTNQERRAALANARRRAVTCAELADGLFAQRGEDGPEVALAIMWAAVADALKDGNPDHDSVVDLEPAPFSTGIITR